MMFYRKATTVFLFILLSFTAFSQKKYSISGYLKDAKNGEELIGATVYSKEAKVGVPTNTYGFYSLTLPEGKHSLEFTYVGFITTIKEIDLTSNMKIDVELNDDSKVLQEVEIIAEGPQANIKSTEMGVSKVDMNAIKAMPALLGEVDVIRSIQTLPGIATVGEGASGYNARGGAIDQNLILLDEAPVYNSSHLLGFFSVFNPDAVKDVKLSKAAIPANYGGRLSSILDVRLKEGNMKTFSGAGGVGTIFSRFSLEGPIKKDKASFIIAARRSYIDVLARPFLQNNPDFKGFKFYFYDLTGKVNWIINKNNRVFLSSYFGRDAFGGTGALFSWGNRTITARWNHVFNNKLFMNLTIYNSKYDYKLSFGENQDDSFNWTSNITNRLNLKPDFTYYASNKIKINFGGQAIQYKLQPANGLGVSRGQSTDIGIPFKYGIETALYTSFDQKITPKLSIQYGLRFSSFNQLGNDDEYYYGDSTGNFKRPVQGSKSFGKNEQMQARFNFEPRLAANYNINENSSVKASYNRMAQYIHLLSNTTASVPIDIYMISTNNLKPQLVDQYSFGYFRNIGEKKDIELSAEVYYKDFQNQVEFVDGAQIRFNRFVEGEVNQGIGRAYGLELYAKKSSGRLTGWISYTLSKTERKTIGINQGNWYNSRYDRPNNFNMTAAYELTKRLTVSATFTAASGATYNFPTKKVIVNGYLVAHDPQESRNNLRLPSYHRLDVAATLKGKLRTTKSNFIKTFQGEWVFSIYNVYARRNAFTVAYGISKDDIANEVYTKAAPYKYSILGTFIPGVTYNFKF